MPPCCRLPLPLLQIAGCQLQSCTWTAPEPSNGGAQLGGGGKLTLGHLQQMPGKGMQALLAALLPASQRLGCLRLEHCRLQVPALQECPRLAALPELQLHFCSCPSPGGLGAALQPLLEQARSLSGLTCFGRLSLTTPSVLPPCLAAETGLKQLRLRQNHLEHLPPGSYLTSECRTWLPAGCWA